MCPCWTSPSKSASPATPEVRSQIDVGVRRAAYRIIEGKGATYYGIGAGLASIVGAIRDDERAVLTVALRTTDAPGCEGVSLSLPRVVQAGTVMTMRPILTPVEMEAIQQNAHLLRGIAEKLSIGGK